MEDLSDLIGQIYDTVTDPALWPTVLGEIAEFTQSARVILILEEADAPLRSVFYTSYADPEFFRTYMDRYLLINPMRLATADRVTSGDIVLTKDFMTPGEYGGSRFAREFLDHHDIVDIAVAVLEKTATSITVLSVQRNKSQGFADEVIRQKIKLLAPHVRRSIAIGHAFEEKSLAAAALAETMDTLVGAVFLLDAEGRVIHANGGAKTLLDRKDVVRQVGTLLVPVDAAARAALADALLAARDGDVALGTQGTSIAFAITTDSALVGTIMPLTDGARRPTGYRYKAVAALCVRETAFQTPSAVAILEQRFELTQRETTVLLTMVEAGGVRETAAILGLSQSTVKSHAKSIFAKTGARRQSDLVKLVAGATSPFRPK